MTTDLLPGQISWNDLTVPDAEPICKFYQAVVGWTSSPVNMDGYSDYSMVDSSGNVVAGICHARGENSDIPPHWLMYVTVADLDRSVTSCNASGGTVVDGPRNAGGGRIAVIKDPAGAVLALFEPEVQQSDEPASPDGDV